MKKLLLLSLLVLFGCSKEDNTELIDSYTSQISSLNSQLTQLNSQLIQSQSQISSLQSQVNSISGLEANISALNSQITDYQSQVTSLQSQISELNTQVNENSNLQATIDSLNAQITSKNELISSLQAQIASLENIQTTSTDTSSDTDNWPNYASQGHTFSAIGIWRLYSVDGTPVSESQRFNIKVYPDTLNPVLLTGNGTINPRDTGLLDFGTTTGIGWTYVVDGSQSFNRLDFNIEDINGVFYENSTNRALGNNALNNTLQFYNEANPLRIEVSFPLAEVDTAIFPSGIVKAVFYKVSD
ncbi:hypothetical protein N9R90_00615 [Flavobacteriaceae bacterium]|nr:hypothetical protein [Flavobacteriaceae bacterium]